ncbi:MAG: metal-dependent hydrolase [Terriglobales bacterium]
MDTRGVKITWCGHATFRIQSAGKTYYIDPFLAHNPACPEAEKNPKHADAILLTHGHTDHLADLLPLAKSSSAPVVCIIETGAWLASKGVPQSQLHAINKGGSVSVAGAKVTMVHALHSNGIDDGGRMVYGGDPAGLVIEFAEGLRIYHAGDTDVFGDMALIAELYKPDLVLLPIGDFFTMGPRGAALACRLLKAPAVVPMHFGTFPVLTGTPQEFREQLRSFSPSTELVVLKPGETLGAPRS